MARLILAFVRFAAKRGQEIGAEQIVDQQAPAALHQQAVAERWRERRLGARDRLVRRVTLVLTLGVFLVEDAVAENDHAGFAGWNGTGGTATLRN